MEMNFEKMNKTAIREKVREALTADFIEFLKEKYGEFVDNDPNSPRVRQTASNEVGIIVGKALDNEGYTKDVVALVKTSVPSWWDSVGPKGKVTNAYDFDEAADEWKFKVEQDEIKKAKKKK